MFETKLNRKKFINLVDGDKIWSKVLNVEEILELLKRLEKEISKHKFENDNNFIMNPRRTSLRNMIYENLDTSNEKMEEKVKEALFNFWEFVNDEYDGNLSMLAAELNLSPDELTSMCKKYRESNIICLQEKDAILGMIQKIKDYICKGEMVVKYKDIDIEIIQNEEESRKHIEVDFKVLLENGIDNLIKEKFIPWLLGSDFLDKDIDMVFDGLKIYEITYTYGRIVGEYSPTGEENYFGQFEFSFISDNDYTDEILDAAAMGIYVLDGKIVNVRSYDI